MTARADGYTGMVAYQVRRRLALQRRDAGEKGIPAPATGTTELLGRNARSLAEVWAVPDMRIPYAGKED